MSVRIEHIGDATLYLGDCRDIAPALQPDAIVADPPYGQGYKVNTFYAGGTRENAVIQRNGKTLKVRPNIYNPIAGDDRPFDPEPWISAAPEVLLWGAHKFADRLPPGGWLVWDKVPTGKVRDQGDGEAAWLNRDQPLRIFRLLWDGLCVGVGARHEVTAGQQRYHPAQKPEALMRWCLTFIRGTIILDPFMGSGTTGVAALQLSRKFVGIESEPHYFDIACRRIEAEARQGRLNLSTDGCVSDGKAPNTDESITQPLTPAELEADSLGSYNAAMVAIGEQHRSGRPLPPSMLSRKEQP